MSDFPDAQLLTGLCVFAAWFGGGIVSVVTGFGCGLFALPIMLLCVPVESAFPVAIILCSFSMFLVLIKFWKNVDYSIFLFCFLFALPGAFFGVWLLRNSPVRLVELAFGIFLIGAVVWEIIRKIIVGNMKPVRNSLLEASLAFFAGVINGVCGMGGPAMGVYAALAHWDKDVARGTFGLFFGTNIFICVLLLWHFEMLGSVELTLAGWGIPGAFAGTLAGIPVASRIPQHNFMRLLLLVILVSGIVLIRKGLAY